MIWFFAGVLALVGAAVWIAIRIGRRRRSPWNADLPAELQGARMWATEEEFACEAPVPLVGRPDAVFQTATGLLVPVDVKSRARPELRDGDVVQLSTYRVILAKSQKLPVADFGFVLAVTPRGEKYVRARLLGEEQIVAMHGRYHALKNGAATGKRTEDGWKCGRCAYRAECSRT